jgi:hypothetical protein
LERRGEPLSRFFVQQPLHILGVAAMYLLTWAALRWGIQSGVRHVDAILVPAAGWLAYAAWEWLVWVKTPEANIRVDLLAIWPLLVILTLWAVVKAFLRT